MRTAYAVLWVCLTSGCAMLPSRMPAEYISEKHSIEISIDNKLIGPELYSEHGGVLSGAMWLTRWDNMKECLAGIDPQTATVMLEKNLRKELAPTFEVKNKEAQLMLEVTLKSWGWRLKAGTAGLKQDDYHLYLMGTARILDQTKQNQRIYNGYIGPEISVGWTPTRESSEAAYPKVIEKFAQDLHRYILMGKPE